MKPGDVYRRHPLNTEIQGEVSKSPESSKEPDKKGGLKLFPLAPTFRMELHGTYETGGVLEFFVGDERLEFIKLPRVSWAIVAELFFAAIRSESTHWWEGFRSTDRLVQSLEKHDVSAYPNSQTVFRQISSIRSKLSALDQFRKFSGSKLQGNEWAKLVLEHSGRSGYRIGLPPGQLRLTIDAVDYESE